jgi:hypothetical protein
MDSLRTSFVGPIITLCKAAELPPGREDAAIEQLLSVKKTRRCRKDFPLKQTVIHAAAGDQQRNTTQP